ncbi:MAG: cysteine synthase A [Eubacterium sp.]|nr:cysteine synthase A [Eubacterium sp.]
MIFHNVLEAMGHTPVIELRKMTGPDDARVLVKYEGLNVGGSIKTLTAAKMVEEAEKRGVLKEDSIIVEPTSGNQGIGLALVGAVKGYRVIIIMPDSVSKERRMLVSQYGAEVKLIHDNNDIGECIEKCNALANKMAAEDPRVFVPNQFSNPDNPLAHIEGTALEILDQVDVPIDAFCSGIGTGGTLTGVGQILQKKWPDILLCAVEPQNAAILSGGSVGTHQQMGIGDGLIPDVLDTDIYKEIHIVTDEEAILTTQQLAKKEGILCGISSGTNVCAALKLARRLGKGKTVLTILPDTGERYFSTPLFEEISFL